MKRCLSLIASLFLCPIFLAAQQNPNQSSDQWPTYGGDPGGQRHTASRQITPANVSHLVPAWTFHTGSVAKNRPGTKQSAFESTPILFRGALYVTSPFDEVFAVNPETGAKLWEYDPHLTRNTGNALLTSRGVAAWSASAASNTAAAPSCSARIYVATMDARLIALDAATGAPCTDFGNGGSVDLSQNVGNYRSKDPYFFTSPPTVIGDLLVIGSAVGDNDRVDIDSGVVRAFDCRTGRLVWSWDPIPWAQLQKIHTGAANAWGVIAADPEHNLVFIPTGAPSPDFYGGLRPGDNRDANSVVALEATTGRRVWGFQVVHHDIWDYDVASEPVLFNFRGNVPAIAITTKMGMIFVLNRLTGEPLYPVIERPVPASDVPGETTSPTQPFQQIDSLVPLSLPPDAKLGATPQDDADCRRIISGLRYEGIYTPVSLRGTLAFPGSLGGVNWGSPSFDPASGILYANTNRYAFVIRLVPAPSRLHAFFSPVIDSPAYLLITCSGSAIILILLISMLQRRSLYPGRIALILGLVIFLASLPKLYHYAVISHQRASLHAKRAGIEQAHFGHEFSPQTETPYFIDRRPAIATSGHPCTVMPWGAVSAVNLNTGKTAWQTPLGTLLPGEHTGTPNMGGPLTTATGLIFAGASEEPLLRAFDSSTGKELWDGALPVPAQSGPMSYTVNGRQYVVIAAGGHGGFGTPLSDALVAFALPVPVKP